MQKLIPKFVLFAAFLLPPLLPQTASVLFAMAAALLAGLYVRSRSKSVALQFAWPLLVMAIPLVYGAVTNQPDDWGRDVARLLKPAAVMLAALLFGHSVARRWGAGAVEKLAILAATLSCVIYILFGIHGRTDTTALLQFDPLVNRGGFYLWIPALLLLVARFMMGRRLGRLDLACAALLTLCIFQSQSRAVVLAVVVGGGCTVLRSRLRELRPGRLVFIAALVAALAAVTLAARFADTPGVAQVNEMEFTAADFGEESQRWRGFEAFMAVRMWSNGTLFEQAFGHGMGAQIDLQGSYFLAGRYYESLPASHNGYATLLAKTGVLGIVSYLLMCLSLVVVAWRTARLVHRDRKPAVLAALGAAIMIPVLTFTVEGIVSPGAIDPMLTFVAAVLGANTRRIKRWRPTVWDPAAPSAPAAPLLAPVRVRRLPRFVWLRGQS